ncbi:MAG: hypothetical protein K6T90_09560 [Leptolyngbyaceae cyanobacterium HOT.MB2.61]|nr:hypothetical protein [Leptolyngbyaceae cyanobacterium HOT.MB2.61]
MFATIFLSGKADPEPASASKKQPEKRLKREFTVNSYCFVQSVLSVSFVSQPGDVAEKQ